MNRLFSALRKKKDSIESLLKCSLFNTTFNKADKKSTRMSALFRLYYNLDHLSPSM